MLTISEHCRRHLQCRAVGKRVLLMGSGWHVATGRKTHTVGVTKGPHLASVKGGDRKDKSFWAQGACVERAQV